MPLQPGDKLGPYEILAPIGAGGMGEVYKAHDPRMGHDVAIKISAERFSERFSREVHAVAALNHPNICTVHDVGPNYLVMELVEGPTLAERIKLGAIPLEDALAIARQMADALEAAHEKGIVHRDLKPGNVKITPSGAVKVLDFGLAKVMQAAAAASQAEAGDTLTIGLTEVGMIMGTAAYMAPEQARGEPVDKRADIWAFGVVLHEMLTGQRLFGGKTVSDTLAAVLTRDPAWDTIPERAAPLLRRCLERDPRRRLRDIGEARFLLEEAPTIQPAARQRQAWLAWSTAGVFFAVAAVLGYLQLREKPPVVAEPVRFQIPAPEKTRFDIYVKLSPDGRRIAFSAAGPDGRVGLWVRDLQSLESRFLPGTEGVGSAFWSPNSRFIAFGEGNRLKKVDASGGPPETLYVSPNAVGSGAWSPDDVIVFGSRGGTGPLRRISAAGGEAVAVTVVDSSRKETYHSHPSFLANGRHFVYFRNSTVADNIGVYLGSLDSKPEEQGTKRLLATQFGAAYAPSPDSDAGRLLFLREGTLMAQAFDPGRLELTGEPLPIAEGVGSTNTYGHFAVSANGVLAYRTGSSAGGTQLTWFDREGNALGAASEPANFNTVALSPDGARAAVSRAVALGGSGDLWMHVFARGTSTRFTSDPTNEYMAVWSPDGNRVAYSSSRDQYYNLYLKASSGAGNESELLKSSEHKYAYDWSSDGRFLLYGVTDPKSLKLTLWTVPLSGDPKPASYLNTQFNQHQAQFSPDSRWIAYSSDETGRNEIYVQPFPVASGGKWPVSTDGGTQPRWRRDGKELFYISVDSRLMAVEVSSITVNGSLSFHAGVPKALFPAPIFGGGTLTIQYRYDVTSDGKRFLINTVAGAATPASSSPITVVLNWQAGLRK